MSDVFRKRTSGFSLSLLPGYMFHGVFAVLALWLLAKALGA
jgi:hypothetical protein